MPRPNLANLCVAAAVVGGFAGAGHYAATELIRFHQTDQLDEFARVVLRRAEKSVRTTAAVLEGYTARRAASCDPDLLQSIRRNVYQIGEVKDLRVTDGRGDVLCSAFPETLNFDQGWTEREDMLAAADERLRLFRVDQVSGSALGLLKEPPGEGVPGIAMGLSAVLGFAESALDIMPTELEDASVVRLTLADNRTIVRVGPDTIGVAQTPTTVWAASGDLPLRATIAVYPAALARWGQGLYWPILGLAVAFGAVFAALVWRLANRPGDPVRELDRAIVAGEFEPFLQPIFDLASGRITGAEILARRVLRDGTVIPPSRFIELAETTGRIGPITWVLLEKGLRELSPVFERDAAFRVSINIAPRHFAEANFAAELQRTVGKSGVDPSRVTLELTEREAFAEINSAALSVRNLQMQGFRIALDDVGTGHSGLSQIQSLRADVMKIDKFFVDAIGRDESASVMVSMLARLAAEMRMGVVAEGIEHEVQVAALIACGVSSGQGYLVSPPVSPASFLRMVEERSVRETSATVDSGVDAAETMQAA